MMVQYTVCVLAIARSCTSASGGRLTMPKGAAGAFKPSYVSGGHNVLGSQFFGLPFATHMGHPSGSVYKVSPALSNISDSTITRANAG